MDEIEKLSSLEGSKINNAKEKLAYEVTMMIHGEKEAKKAYETSKALFSKGTDDENMPHTIIGKDFLKEENTILDLLKKSGLTKSNGEGRRLIKQGGVSINEEKVDDIFLAITKDLFVEGKLTIKKGKKTFHQIRLD